MSENEEKRKRMSRVASDIILESTEQELDAALREAGRDPEDLVVRGHAAIERALAQAGAAQSKSAEEVSSEMLHRGLGALVRMLRLKKKLTTEKLAERVRVAPEELRRIEKDPSYTPGLRTIAQLEDFFRLTPRSLGVLAGAVRVQHDVDAFCDRVQAFGYAAHSSGMDKLTREDKRRLDEFVQFLAEWVE